MNIPRSVIAIALVVVVVAVIIGVTVFQQEDPSLSDDSSTITVATSFYILEHFTRAVGKEHVDVSVAVPGGVEPHDFEPTPQTISNITSADVFLYYGAGLDPWAEDLAANIPDVRTLEMTSFFSLRQLDAKTKDPHLWLDPVLAMQNIERIRDVLMEEDPANAEDYRANAATYIDQLAELHAAYTSGLARCDISTIIVAHDAFGYMTERYAFFMEPISGLSPEDEPSLAKLAEVVEIAREKNIQYIFFETLTSPKLAETIAVEIGGGTLVLNPMEGLTQEQQQAGETYLSVMRQNLENLRLARRCS